MVFGNGREVYAHSGTNGELKVYRTGPVKGKDELNAFEGTDTTELEMEGLNLE